jgi:phage baseplate assembly protein gpV
MTIPRTLEDQIAELYRRDAERTRRDRNRRRTGTVKEGPDDKGRYRVLLTRQDGKEFLSGWIKPRPLGAGKVKIDVILKEGEQVDVVSESGDMTDARIEMSDYSEANQRENESTPLHIKVDGDAVIIAGKVKITADVEIAGRLDITGDGVTHNGKDIGDTHRHTDVEPGPALTGVPA